MRLVTGSWQLATGDWRLATGYWRLATNDRNSCFRVYLLNDDPNIRITGRSFLASLRQDDKGRSRVEGGTVAGRHKNIYLR